jgi:HlyD family secretion protein
MFRGAALKRVQSPEQLDAAVRVTLPRQWLALGAVVLVVLAGVAWSLTSNVPTTLSGPGYYLPQEGLERITSPIPGTVSSIAIGPGAQVTFGRLSMSITPVGGGRAVDVPASVTGVVTEVAVGLGSYVQAGERLALVKPGSRPVVVYTYVPIAKSADLRPGVPARVTFGGGIGATYGYVQGTIRSVSPFAVSEERLRFVLGTDALVSQVRALGPVNEILVRLTPSKTTRSGLVWGSGAGPPAPLPPGLSTGVKFVLGSHHPIDDVL